MKKSIAAILIILSCLLILDSFNFGHALMMFLLAGIIPGTNIIVSGDQMLGIIAGVGGFIIARFSAYFVRSYTSQITSAHDVQAHV